MYYSNSRKDPKQTTTRLSLLGSKIDTGVGKSLIEQKERLNGQKDYDDLKKKYLLVLRENTRLKKELASFKGIPFT